MLPEVGLELGLVDVFVELELVVLDFLEVVDVFVGLEVVVLDFLEELEVVDVFVVVLDVLVGLAVELPLLPIGKAEPWTCLIKAEPPA